MTEAQMVAVIVLACVCGLFGAWCGFLAGFAEGEHIGRRGEQLRAAAALAPQTDAAMGEA